MTSGGLQVYTADPKRRSFFKLLGGLIGGGVVAGAGYSFFTREGAIDQWVAVGPLEQIPADAPQRISLSVIEKGPWLERNVQKVVWLRRKPDNTVQALSGACPHMNCTVAWKRELNGFDCACHISNFDATGQVLSGPSPRSLDGLEYRIENGILNVRYQKFRRSVPEKEVYT